MISVRIMEEHVPSLPPVSVLPTSMGKTVSTVSVLIPFYSHNLEKLDLRGPEESATLAEDM